MSNQYTPIRIYKTTNKKIDQLKSKLSFASKIELVDEMVNFFLDEGIDPKHRLNAYKHVQDIKKVVTNRINTAIGFIQENESRYLEPMMKLLKDQIAIKTISDTADTEKKIEVKKRMEIKESPDRLSENLAVEDQRYKERFDTLKNEFDDLLALVKMREVKGERNQKFPVINMMTQEWYRTAERINNI